jgi:hypothetical protein
MAHEVRQRAHVLIVVAYHLDERVGRTTAQEVEVPPRDLPALHVADAMQPEQLGLGCAKPSVGHPVTKQPAHEGKEIEVTGVFGSRPASHAKPCHEQRPIEATTVVRHQPRVRRNPFRDQLQEGGLLAMIGEQQLDLAEQIALPPPEADEERHRPRRGREAGRLGVEADQRGVGRRLTGQLRQPLAVDRQVVDAWFAADNGAPRRAHDLALDRLGHPLGEVR